MREWSDASSGPTSEAWAMKKNVTDGKERTPKWKKIDSKKMGEKNWNGPGFEDKVSTAGTHRTTSMQKKARTRTGEMPIQEAEGPCIHE